MRASCLGTAWAIRSSVVAATLCCTDMWRETRYFLLSSGRILLVIFRWIESFVSHQYSWTGFDLLCTFSLFRRKQGTLTITQHEIVSRSAPYFFRLLALGLASAAFDSTTELF